MTDIGVMGMWGMSHYMGEGPYHIYGIGFRGGGMSHYQGWGMRREDFSGFGAGAISASVEI